MLLRVFLTSIGYLMQKPSRTKEIPALVAASPWLRAIDTRLANSLVNSGRSVSVESGAGIYALSDHDQSVFAVVSGAVGIQLDDGQSGIVLGHVFGPGAWFGEAAAITGSPRQIGAIALTDCQLLRVPYEALIQLEQDDQPIRRALGTLAVTNGALAIRVARDLMLADSNCCNRHITKVKERSCAWDHHCGTTTSEPYFR